MVSEEAKRPGPSSTSDVEGSGWCEAYGYEFVVCRDGGDLHFPVVEGVCELWEGVYLVYLGMGVVAIGEGVLLCGGVVIAPGIEDVKFLT